MSPLEKEVERLTTHFVLKGAKSNRMQQRARMMAFANSAATLGARSMGQVGKTHVIRYWKDLRQLSDSTRHSHWLALKILWKLAEKPLEPPEPWTTKQFEQARAGGMGASPHVKPTAKKPKRSRSRRLNLK